MGDPGPYIGFHLFLWGVGVLPPHPHPLKNDNLAVRQVPHTQRDNKKSIDSLEELFFLGISQAFAHIILNHVCVSGL